MKILHVVGSLDRGGVETWLTQVLAPVDRQKYQMDFLVHTAEPGAYDQQIRARGSRILTCLPRLDQGRPLGYARSFRRVLRQYGPYDCVHCHIHHSSGFILLLAAWMGVPIRIVHSHNDTLASDARKSILRRIYDTAMKLLMRRYATAGIAISRAAARSLFPRVWTLPASTSTDKKWEICPYGIDLEPFRVSKNSGSPEKAALRAELGLSPAAIVIGHVGRFAAQKNHLFLIEIAACLCRKEPAAVFLLIGVGPDRAAIEARVAELGLRRHFVFAGSRPDVPRLMKDVMDCFLFPSFYEGLGLVLWEAQAAGLPCLIADALPEEASLVPGQVQRLSLSLAPEVWAADLLHLVKTYQWLPREDFPPAVAAISIEASSSRLISIYDGYMDQRRGRTVHGLATA